MYDEILSHKKEANPAMCDNMDGPWWHYAMWNKLNTVWSHLYVEFKWEKKKRQWTHRFREEIGGHWSEGVGGG